ncbi:MAG TPA: aldo/keto reductase [Myxococcota bacterium]|nr:aldo/keto reductase [Myxococcota bacterium]
MGEEQRCAGRATPEGTRRFAERFPSLPGHFRRPDRLTLSSLGLGTKPGAPGGVDDLCYRSVVPRALEAGVNVFDTALSYRQQTSERALGRALARAFREKVARRDEVFVISKCGYLAPDAESVMDGRRYLVRTYLDSGLVALDEVVNGVHVLSPRFIAHQIEQSRRNLGLETIDLYLLEDPELQLAARGPTGFRDALASWFETLEAAVEEGAIAAYGLSTWHGLLVPYGERGHVSMFELLEAAIEVGGADHHLRGIALPYSVGQGEARALASQFGPEARATNLFDTLRDTGTAVFTSGSLVQGRAARGLPLFFRQAFPGLTSDAQRCLQFARSTPGVTTALVGMRSPEHVDENLALAEHEPAKAELIDALFERARRRAEG